MTTFAEDLLHDARRNLPADVWPGLPHDPDALERFEAALKYLSSFRRLTRPGGDTDSTKLASAVSYDAGVQANITVPHGAVIYAAYALKIPMSGCRTPTDAYLAIPTRKRRSGTYLSPRRHARRVTTAVGAVDGMPLYRSTTPSNWREAHDDARA